MLQDHWDVWLQVPGLTFSGEGSPAAWWPGALSGQHQEDHTHDKLIWNSWAPTGEQGMAVGVTSSASCS